jgi:simple sugar transport system ATP-binding protein
LTLLSLRGISKRFGDVAANVDVSLDVEAGEIHALLGENGAGKTTLMNVVYGIYASDAGTVAWRGQPVRIGSPRQAIATGIGMVHQNFMLVRTLTVAENVVLGLDPPGHPFPDRQRVERAVGELSRRHGLEVDPGARVGDLSVGEQQRVEILKLLHRDAQLLVLDEPTAVLTPGEVERLFDVLRRLRAEGRSVILITHRIPEVLAVSDRITVLRGGRVVASLRTAETSADALSRQMIGRPVVRPQRSRRPASGEPGLELQGLRAWERGVERLADVSLAIAPGEIVGVAGVDGNGQKELAECVLGVRQATAGAVRLGGESLDRLGTAARRGRGLAFVSDDRQHDGLVLDLSLAENYLLGFLADRRFVRRGFLFRARADRETAAAIAAFDIAASGPDVATRLLSGGSQQKLVLARELASAPRALVAFQPSRGLDPGAAEFVGGRLLERREAGCAILLISADLEELLWLSDRLTVMSRGRLSAPVENDGSLDLTRLGLQMAGHPGGGAPCAS